MVVLEGSKENFIVEVPYVEDLEVKQREEERKRTGRYLAVTVVLFLIALGLYHSFSNKASKLSVIISAAMIMFLYLVGLLYAAQRRKQKQKKVDLTVEKQVTSVLKNLNNIKNLHAPIGSHDNYVYSSSEEDPESEYDKSMKRPKSENIARVLQKHAIRMSNNRDCENGQRSDDERKSSKGSDIFIRTYSIA